MGPVNWFAVVLAAFVAAGIDFLWRRTAFLTSGPPASREGQWTGKPWLVFIVMLIAAAMLGHAFARIGSQTLDAKPWLFFMQSGGIAIAFIIPAVWLTNLRGSAALRTRLADSGLWLTSYLAIGTVFWALG